MHFIFVCLHAFFIFWLNRTPPSLPSPLSSGGRAQTRQRQLLPSELKLGLGKTRNFFSPYKVPVAVEVTTLADRLAAVLGLEVSSTQS